MLRVVTILFLSLVCFSWLGAQNLPEINYQKAYEVPDSAILMGINDFYALVLENHPVVKQADLQPEKARQMLRSARGHFDPKIEVDWDVKEFKGTDYYNILNAGLKIPVWFPVDIKAGVDRNTGVFLNPEKFPWLTMVSCFWMSFQNLKEVCWRC